MRKYRTIALAAALIFMASSAFAGDAVRIYGRILAEATTVQQKYAIATSIAALNDPDAAQYVADALDWALATRSSIKTGPEREIYERLSRTLLKSLGDWRYTNAATSAMRAIEDSPDPLTKAEALTALGSMRAVEYAERISLMLRDLNNEPSADRDAGEKIAFGCVLALERMRSPVGFSPLFFASEGWYSRRVRDQAERSLPLILEDPSDAVMAILSVETPPRMIRALALELRSAAPAAGKGRVASMALLRGIASSPRNRTEENQLSELRVMAMNALAAMGPGDGSLASNLTEAYRIGPTDERLVALKAMGADRTAASARALRDIILDLNSAQLAGVVDETRNSLMRAALQNAAINANKELAPAIQTVLINSGWSGGVLALASAAQKALQ
ncbi:MAG: hypothetical protein CVV51_04480 [Spirochaetae bacterium HGW-Spirochaetae-7]|jgi:hypothetical protein|nr:MAG: hypothetical protein CVV51_04480 [Spirochaetae bacterium HGW-Spirochaetae-7]